LGDFLPPSPKLDEIPLPILLPRLGADGGNGAPSISILTLKEFTEVAAPKFTQDEDIYALGLAEAAREFFGEEIGELVRGEGILSVKTAELLLGAIRSGAFGRNDLLSNDTIQSSISFVGNTLSSLRGNAQSNAFEGELTEAVSNLDEDERARLDDIVSSITERSLRSLSERLEKIR
jgi:hypothetical protein